MDLKLDGLEFLYFCLEIIKVSENYDLDRKEMVDIVMETVDANIKELNGIEFMKFCFNLSKTAEARGIDSEVMISVITEATINREKVLGKRENEEKEEIRVEYRDDRQQLLYGPPPVQEIHYMTREPEQPLYGPPPMNEAESFEEKSEPEQALYGPPSIHR